MGGSEDVAGLLSDCKTQVTLEYAGEDGTFQNAHTILISTQRPTDQKYEQSHQDLVERITRALMPSEFLNDGPIFHNPSGDLSNTWLFYILTLLM